MYDLFLLLSQLIEQPLRQLAEYRKEVSNVRLQLILKHQSYIELKKVNTDGQMDIIFLFLIDVHLTLESP